MPFGLGKSETRPEEDDVGKDEPFEGSEDTPVSSDDNGAEVDGSAVAEAIETDVQTEAGNSHRPVFRPDYLDEDVARVDAAVAAPTRKLPEGDTFFVSVMKQDGSEIHRFDDVAEVQGFIEGLLGEGVPEDEVAAYRGSKLALEVAHRPVVKLLSDQED